MKPQPQKRGPKGGRDTGRKIRKKTSVLTSEKVEYVDYKDVNLLQRFVSDRSKIRARRVSGNDVQQQRDIAIAIKNARELALLPYTKRVSTQRTGRPDRGDKGSRYSENAPDEAADDDDEAIDAVAATEGED